MELRGTIRCYLMITAFVIGLSGFVSDGITRAADWPNWRGPEHNGVSKETGWVTSKVNSSTRYNRRNSC